MENLYGIALKFSYSECIVKSAAGGEIVLSLSAPFPAEIGDEVLLVREAGSEDIRFGNGKAGQMTFRAHTPASDLYSFQP